MDTKLLQEAVDRANDPMQGYTEEDVDLFVNLAEQFLVIHDRLVKGVGDDSTM